MFEEIMLNLNYSFTKEEKERGLLAIKQINKLVYMVRKSVGYMELERELEDESYSFFQKTAIELVIDGTNASLVEQILKNLILAENHTGAELLERLIFAQGIVMIQKWEFHPQVIPVLLALLLGETVIPSLIENETIVKLMSEDEIETSYYKLCYSLENKATLPECIEFANYIKCLSDRSIQMMLQIIDMNDLACACKGCEGDVIRSIADNMSLKTARNFLEMLVGKEEELVNMVNVQKRILDHLKKLEDSGEFFAVNK